MYRNRRVVVEAPCKVNLFLDITGTAAKGYHLLDMVLLAVDLADLVVVSRTPGSDIRLSSTHSHIPLDERNLAYRAAEAFRSAAGIRGGLHIHIDKIIPDQAGLGGGSADAAAVLAGLNQLEGFPLSDQRLAELGLSLGADVPFMLRGGCCRAQGVGEKLAPLPLPDGWLVIVKPDTGISTAEAYSAYDRHPRPEHRGIGPLLDALGDGRLPAGEVLFNAFEQVHADDHTRRIKESLLQDGAAGAVLSGSGSAVSGLFSERETAEKAMALSRDYRQVFLARPVSHGAQVIYSG